MSSSAFPLVILGGSDSSPTQLPPTGRGKRPLTGCKAVDLTLAGEPLINRVVERFAENGRFDPIYVAGPAAAFEGVLHGAREVFDTDAGFGVNVQVAVESARARHPTGVLSMATCDILPGLEDLEVALDDYDSDRATDLWFPLVRVPDNPQALGASSWKPSYVLRRGDGTTVSILPGHLTIFHPEAMRLRFLYGFLDTLYRSRNRPILYRRAFLFRRMLGQVLFHDLLHVLRLRLPTLTWDTAVGGGAAARRLRDQTMTLDELPRVVRRLIVKRRHRRRAPHDKIRLPILDTLSLAQDIDTLEEARAVGAR